MPDKFMKSHPWRFNVLRPFDQDIGPLVIKDLRTGQYQQISESRTIPQAPGERMSRTKREAVELVNTWRTKYGADVVSDVYRAA
jgi:hypothetical protein